MLDRVIKYMEESEESFDGEYGVGRDLHDIVLDGDMPELYDELLALRNKKLGKIK